MLTQGTAGTTFHQLGVTNTGAVDRILVNLPVLHFQDACCADLGITAASGTDCPAGGPYDPTTCLDKDAVDLPPGAATPGVVNGQLTVTVAVADIGVLAPCTSSVQAHFIGLRFTGLTDDVGIEVPNDIALQTCANQVTLHGLRAVENSGAEPLRPPYVNLSCNRS